METTVKQRLISFIDFLGISKNAFENACGLSTRYVSNITNSVTPQKLKQISLKYPELNTAWLLTGEGEMLKSTQPSVEVIDDTSCAICGKNCADCNKTTSCEECLKGAPIIPTTISKSGDIDILEWVSGRRSGIERSSITVDGIRIDVWHRLRDSSLVPDYRIGDMLGLLAYPKGEEKPIPGKLYAVDTSTNGLVVRLLYPEEGGYRAHAFNTTAYPDFFIDSAEVIRIYRVMIMVRL